MYAESEKRYDQIQYTMHGILGENRHQGKKYRQKGYKIKNGHSLIICRL